MKITIDHKNYDETKFVYEDATVYREHGVVIGYMIKTDIPVMGEWYNVFHYDKQNDSWMKSVKAISKEWASRLICAGTFGENIEYLPKDEKIPDAEIITMDIAEELVSIESGTSSSGKTYFHAVFKCTVQNFSEQN